MRASEQDGPLGRGSLFLYCRCVPFFVKVGGRLHHRAEMPLGMPASTHGKLSVQSAPDPVDMTS